MLRLSRFLKKRDKSTHPLPSAIIKIIGENPQQESIYWEALTHSSSKIKDKHENLQSFERLEFLGDAVLSAVVSQYLFQEKPYEMEGYLTKFRAKIVSRNNLNMIGERLKLSQHLRIDVGMKPSQNINGDLLEALIGAIFIDKGFDKAKKVIIKNIIEPYISLEDFENKIDSFKSLLYEWVQKNKKVLNYNTFEEDNAEDLTIFVCIIRLDNVVIAKGRGASKKKAEENASRRAFQALKNKM